jgi:hypothetical protein
MPSQPLDSGWNFSSVFDLIESDTHNITSPTLRPAEASPPPSLSGGVGLGNFWKLYEGLGMRTDVAAPLPPLDESELSNSDDALLPSPLLEASQAPISHNDLEPQPQKITAIAPLPATTKKQRRKARRQAEKQEQEQIIKDADHRVETQEDLSAPTNQLVQEHADIVLDTPTKPPRARSNVGAKIRPTSPVPTHGTIPLPQTPVAQRHLLTRRTRSYVAPAIFQVQSQPMPPPERTTLDRNIDIPELDHYSAGLQGLAQLHSPPAAIPIGSGLIPRTVRPVTVPRHSHPAATRPRVPTTPSPAPLRSAYATPLKPAVTLRSQVDRHFHLFEKLLTRFPGERKWMVSPRQLVNENTRAEGIHVFVDASNIMIGFRDMLRLNGVQFYDMSFDSLALLMERRRPVAKRCFVGSHREANPLPQITRLVETSKAVGYECNVQEQVYIAREESEKKKFFNDVNRLGWQKAIQKRSGSGSDSETGATAAPKTPSAPKWVEQGVDELLHLKMCQSLLDTEVPSTMVLATGDGAEAEMSDGFLAHVERALRKGWKVELITWRQQTNGGYKRKAFRQRWGEQFTIIELDDFLEDLIDTP